MRAIEKKRPPLMNKRRWTTLILLFLVVITALIILYYRHIHMSMWQQESEIKSVIKQSEMYVLDDTESLYKYVWEQAYWILVAKKLGEETLTYSVWDEASLIAELDYNDALTEEEMLSIVERSKANASNIKLQAGYGLGQFVWEVKYRDRNTAHTKIAFYSMSNGILLDEYTIPQDSMPIGERS